MVNQDFLYVDPSFEDIEGKIKIWYYSEEKNDGIPISFNEKKYFKIQKYTDRLELRTILDDFGLNFYSKGMVESIFSPTLPYHSIIFGILNATPDSFYYKSRVDSGSVLPEFIKNDIKFIDLGAESTRPGANSVPWKEEIERLENVIDRIADEEVFISLDTKNIETAEYFIDRVDMINDVSGNANEEIPKLCAKFQKDYVLMHTRGTPKEMNKLNNYSDMLGEISYFFFENIRKIQKFGLSQDKLIIDPGVGFAKLRNQNWEIIRNCNSFRYGFRRMFGHSRKSFLGKKGTQPENKLIETLAVSDYLSKRGVEILRVHDPAETLRLLDTLRRLS